MAGRIEDYALVGDMQTAALVGKDGSIDWLCLPRFDSPACFARLLGTEDHGYWRICPAGTGEPGAPGTQPDVTRRYHGDSLILHTGWRAATGTVRVIDFMPPRDGGLPVLVRIVEGVHDVGLLSEEYDPRYRRLVGNVPQAFSHVPLIQAALNLAAHEPDHCRRPDGRAGRGHGRR